MKNASQKVLEEFLAYPIEDTDELFRRFESLPGAIFDQSKNPLERYVCIPGTRKDRIVLVAHADTVWDKMYGKPAVNAFCFEDGYYRSTNPACGIGADDRAGCAMLWLLRESGHTILLVNGEEKGKIGAKFIREKNPKLFKLLNEHQFMIELDSYLTDRCTYNQVDNSKKFRQYIGQTLGFRDDTQKGGCDLQILCQKICGVNVGIGYCHHHKTYECLVFSQWEHSLACLQEFLAKPQRRFKISILKKISRFLKRVKNKILGA